MAGILLDWSMRTLRLSFFVTDSSIQLPRSGMDPAAVQRPVALAGLDQEVDAGRAVELVDDDPLGPVHDELAAADHHRAASRGRSSPR